MGKTKQQIKNELKAPGLGGDFSRSSDPLDPRRARAAQAASVTSQRYNPDEFEVDAQGRLGLVLTQRRTHTVNVDFVSRYNSAAATAPTRANGSAEGSNPRYAGVVEVFTLGATAATDSVLMCQWVFPPNMDKSFPLTIELNYIDRDAPSGTPAASWDLAYWIWEKGQDLSRTQDGTLQVVDNPLGALDTDTSSKVVIDPGQLTPGSIELKFRIQRRATTSAAYTDPDEIALHAVYLTYGVKWSHSHGGT